MSYFFSKFIDYFDLGTVDYWRCTECGFVASATHYEMSQEEWEQLNIRFHNDPLIMKNNPDIHQPPYDEQAYMLSTMYNRGLLLGEPWLDWGAGQAEISRILADRYSLSLFNFDRFIKPPINALTEGSVHNGAYNLVLNSAVFEHIRSRDTLDEIELCVARNDGVLAIHTLVRGEIPSDPTWMYLLAVHCSFHTNRSMQILMDQWGYHCSVYNERSKLWAMFRTPEHSVLARVDKLNEWIGHKYLHFKVGFMDYWP